MTSLSQEATTVSKIDVLAHLGSTPECATYVRLQSSHWPLALMPFGSVFHLYSSPATLQPPFELSFLTAAHFHDKQIFDQIPAARTYLGDGVHL